MRTLIIDQDEYAANVLTSKLKEMGHEVTWQSSKSVALKLVEQQPFDCVVLDPLPLTSLKPLILDIRRQSLYFPYFILASQDLQALDPSVLKSVHDVIAKPLNLESFAGMINNADHYYELIYRLQDTSEDFPSAGGIVSKSAFGQLFLASIDRSDRYAEETYFMFVSIKNHKEIVEMDGAYAGDYVVAQLAKKLVEIRRQTDIIGQTAKNEFSVLMRAPADEKEPVEAINRFAQTLNDSHLIEEPNIGPVEIVLSLRSIPKCNKIIEHVVTFERTR